MEPLFLEKPVRSVNFEQAFLNPSLRKKSHTKPRSTRRGKIVPAKSWRAMLRQRPNLRREALFHKKAASHEAAKARRAEGPQSKSKGRARHAVAGHFWLNNQRTIFEPVDNMLFG